MSSGKRTSPNPYLKCEALDRIDFADAFRNRLVREYGRLTPEQMFGLQQISDAGNCYLMCGLRDNGPTIREWYFAYEYFFVVRQDRPETWKSATYMRTVAINEETGKRETTITTLSNEELEAMVFDFHYTLSRCDRVMHIDRFRQFLKERREWIVRENEAQIQEYLRALRGTNFQMLESGSQPALGYFKPDFVEVLTDPGSPERVEDLVYPDSVPCLSKHHYKSYTIDRERLTAFVKANALMEGSQPDASPIYQEMEARLQLVC